MLGGIEDNSEPVSERSDAASEDLARTIALRQLGMGARSRKQLEEKMQARDIPVPIIASVLDRFEEVDLINDHQFAQMWVRSRQRSRGLARSALRRELLQKGITPNDAEEALAQIDDDDEYDAAREIVLKRLARQKMSSDGEPLDRTARDKEVRRLVSMLARKGYRSGLAFSVVKEAMNHSLDGPAD